jgi:predicted outer membrane protein
MTATVTVQCTNGTNQFTTSTLEELRKITKNFDEKGTKYEVAYSHAKIPTPGPKQVETRQTF